MNYPLTHPGQVRAAAGLAEVADRYGRVSVISRATVGTAALLDQTAHELSSRRIRCVRVQGPASGGLALHGLIAQIIGQPNPGALTDGDLKTGFTALTEPGKDHRRVALLVADAHSLLPSALRYIQLACQSSPTKLCVVLAGQPGLAAVLAGGDLAYLRGVMHVMELPEPAGQGLFDRTLAMPEPPAVPAASRRGGSSPLVRLGVAALIVPIVGLIWWRHLPASPLAAVPFQDAPSVPSLAAAPSVLSVVEAPATAPPSAGLAERAVEPPPPEPPPPEPGPAAAPQATAGIAAPDPAAPAATPEPSVSEASTPEATAESSAVVTEPSVSTEPPAAPVEPSATLAEPPVAVAEQAPALERSEAPPQATDAAEASAPQPAAPAPDAGPPRPDSAAAKPPASPPRGTLTVTAALPAHGGARRAVAPVTVPPTPALPARAAEDRPSLTDERRCRDIVLKAQLGKDPSDADKQFLRNGCRGG